MCRDQLVAARREAVPPGFVCCAICRSGFFGCKALNKHVFGKHRSRFYRDPRSSITYADPSVGLAKKS